MTYTKVAASCREAEPPGNDDDGGGDDDDNHSKPANGSSSRPETSMGFSTEAALGRLDEDIAALLYEYEEAIGGERFVCGQCVGLCVGV